ncbi:MAG: Rid family detoxifying hydrolase [Halioglobus sp.]
MNNNRTALLSSRAPAPVGPYSHAVIANGFVFTAGLIPTDPESGELIDGDVVAQTERCLETLRIVLEDAGSSMSDVVKTTVYLADIENFEQMNSVYRRFFTEDHPARTTYQPGVLPIGALVEIEAIALQRT